MLSNHAPKLNQPELDDLSHKICDLISVVPLSTWDCVLGSTAKQLKPLLAKRYVRTYVQYRSKYMHVFYHNCKKHKLHVLYEMSNALGKVYLHYDIPKICRYC